MPAFLLKYSLGHCPHLTKRLQLKAENSSRMFAGGEEVRLDKSWKFNFVEVIILTLLNLLRIRFSINTLEENEKRTSRIL
jgi:hypothetical protein